MICCSHCKRSSNLRTAYQLFSVLGLKFLIVNLGTGQIHHLLPGSDEHRDLNVRAPFTRTGLPFFFYI